MDKEINVSNMSFRDFVQKLNESSGSPRGKVLHNGEHIGHISVEKDLVWVKPTNGKRISTKQRMEKTYTGNHVSGNKTLRHPTREGAESALRKMHDTHRELHESAEMHHIGSKGPFHPTRDQKKLSGFHHEVSTGEHKDHVKFSGSHHMVHLHVHKDHKNKPGVKKLIDKFHKL